MSFFGGGHAGKSGKTAWPVEPLLMKAARVFLSISQDNILMLIIIILNIMGNMIYGNIWSFKRTIKCYTYHA